MSNPHIPTAVAVGNAIAVGTIVYSMGASLPEIALAVLAASIGGGIGLLVGPRISNVIEQRLEIEE